MSPDDELIVLLAEARLAIDRGKPLAIGRLLDDALMLATEIGNQYEAALDEVDALRAEVGEEIIAPAPVGLRRVQS